MAYIMCHKVANPNVAMSLQLDRIERIAGQREVLPWATATYTAIEVKKNFDQPHEVIEHPWIIAKALHAAGLEAEGMEYALEGGWGFPWEMPT